MKHPSSRPAAPFFARPHPRCAPAGLFLLAIAIAASSPAADVEVYFSPRGGCEAALVRELDGAEKWIRCQYYGFTSQAVGEALIRAAGRGVKVEILVDRSNETAPRSQAEACRRAGCQVLTDGAHPIAHNKIAIIDGREVVGGSFNPSNQAENYNAENLIIIRDGHVAAEFTNNWQEHAAHSAPYHQAPAKVPLSNKRPARRSIRG